MRLPAYLTKRLLLRNGAEMRATILVTGGAGFIGSHLCRGLLEKGYQVIVVDDLSGGFKENLPKEAIFMEGSINDVRLIQDIYSRYKIRYVYHLAAYAAEGLSHFIKRFNYENNLIGSINLINESVRYNVKCFVFTSSIAVYGSAKPPFKENILTTPEDSYGIAKLAVETELMICKKIFGLNSVIFRPHNVYGEYQNIGDKYRNVVGIFMNQIMNNKPLTVFGNGEQTRAFTYIGDIIPTMIKAIETPEAYNQTFNVGTDQFFSVKELAKTVAQVMGVPSHPIRYLSSRQESMHAYSDHEKIKRVLGCDASVSLEVGVEKMAAWAKAVGPRESKPFENIELRKKLPRVWRYDK